jgi:hypothetical protein
MSSYFTIKKFFLGSVFSMAIAMGSLLGLWLFDRNYPIEIHYRVFYDLSIQEGESYHYTNVFTRKRFCEAKVVRWFVDSYGESHPISVIPYAMSTTSLHVREINETTIPVPFDEMSGGIAEFHFRPEWKCNPLHYIPYTLDLFGIIGVGPILGPEESLPLYIDKDLE